MRSRRLRSRRSPATPDILVPTTTFAPAAAGRGRTPIRHATVCWGDTVAAFTQFQPTSSFAPSSLRPSVPPFLRGGESGGEWGGPLPHPCLHAHVSVSAQRTRRATTLTATAATATRPSPRVWLAPTISSPTSLLSPAPPAPAKSATAVTVRVAAANPPNPTHSVTKPTQSQSPAPWRPAACPLLLPSSSASSPGRGTLCALWRTCGLFASFGPSIK